MRFSQLSFLLAGVAMLSTVPAVQSPSPVVDDDTVDELVTLYAHDDLRSSFSFSSGTFGGVVRDGELILDDADLIFHTLSANHLSYGFVGNRAVNFLDIGSLVVDPVIRATDHSIKPSISVFHTLFLDGPVFHYRGPIKRTHRLSGFKNFVNGPMPSGIRHLLPQVGHTYVLRYRDDVGQGGADEVVKIEVVEFVPDSRLTFRWARL